MNQKSQPPQKPHSTELSRRNFLQRTAIASTAIGIGSGALSACAPAANAVKARAPLVEGSSSLLKLSAVELSAAIKARDVSCVEVMSNYLKHIGALNPRFNALVSLADAETLIAQAHEKDQALSQGHYHGWMHGFPMAIKDLANAKGFLTTNGSPIFKNNIASSDSIHVARMKAAGGIVIGKSNVPEFGLGSQSYNPIFGATLNAYDAKSTAGGSSGGAAAALALHMLPVADGSDFMGSLRNPAGFNNVIGFRPTPGTVPLMPSFIEQLPCNGPMARNVSDAAMLLSTIAGYDKRTPTSIKQDTSVFTGRLGRDFKGTKLGWLGDFDGYLAMEPGVMDVCNRALRTFTDIGCEVEDARVDYSMPELWQTWLTFRHWLTRGKLGTLYTNPDNRKLLKPEAVWEAEGAATLTAQDVHDASAARARWYAALLVAFEKYDFLVLPTAQVFPFDAKTHWPKSIAGKTMDTYHRWMEVVIPGTLSACPVVNVPAGFGENKLPMGLQIIAPRMRDFSALQIAYAYEQSSRWNLDHPPAAVKEALA